MKWLRVALLLAIWAPLTCPAATAEPDAAGLARCATITAAEARLSCYDQLAGRAATAPAPGARSAGTTAAPAAGSVPPPPARTAAPGAAAASAATPAVPSAQAASDRPENFGFSNAQLGAAGLKDEGVQSIQAHISELPGDQLRASYAVLDNGQTWKCTDGDMILRVGEAVTIRRAALGSYMLISESRHTYHVRRLR